MKTLATGSKSIGERIAQKYYLEPILCFYTNATSQIQITRITNISNMHFERVVFPGQRLLFEAVPNAKLEIHSVTMESAIITDRITCSCLRVNE